MKLFEVVNLPKNHWECRLSEIPELPYKAVLEDWIQSIRQNVQDGKGLFLYGKFGTGKSGAAAILVKAAIAKTLSCLWVAAESLPDYKIREQEFWFSEETTMMERIRAVSLLVIDDVVIRELKDQKNQWLETSLEMVIRRRMDQKLCTVITSNHNPEYIKTNVPAIASILKECCLPVRVEGKNFRT